MADVVSLRQEIDREHERLDDPIPGQQDLEGGEAPSDLRVAGTAPLTLFDLGGKRPQSASLSLTGATVELADGQAYRKGDRLYVRGIVVVRAISQKDKVDKATGVVLECVQTHTAVVEDLVIEPAVEDSAA